MHSGFAALRRACPMNLGRKFGERDRGTDVADDVARIGAIWRNTRARYGADGPFLFGAFSGADAMYAPVVTRLDTYSIAVDPVSRAYMDAVLALPAFQAWRDAALEESWVVLHDEVDEPALANYRSLD
jgi:glutathione S-transferase